MSGHRPKPGQALIEGGDSRHRREKGSTNDQAARPNPAQTPPEPPPVQRPGNGQAARPKPVWVRPAVKAMLIVAATALSLYLLKRRFF